MGRGCPYEVDGGFDGGRGIDGGIEDGGLETYRAATSTKPELAAASIVARRPS
jgi:hypothetical protein